MPKVNVGQRFSYLTVIARAGMYWRVRCDCGKEKLVRPTQLAWAERPTRSCGCKRRELLRKARTEHGHSIKGGAGYPTFIAWQSMLWRCYNQKRDDYSNYGGRGIWADIRWHLYANFLADMGERPDGMTLGRIDNDRGYGPTNCRWETLSQQARNTRRTRYLEFNGERLPLVTWAEKVGLTNDALQHRLSSGWSVERALTEPRRGT